MKRFFGFLLGFTWLVSGCYTTIELMPSYATYRDYPVYEDGADRINDSTSATDAYATGFRDGFTDMARFRDEQRWLRWNSWQYYGMYNDPLFWSYNDFYWDPAFYWSGWYGPSWRGGFWGPNWGVGFGNWGWGGGGWGGDWNGCWNCGPVIVIPGDGLANNRVRGPRSSGRRLINDVNNVADGSNTARLPNSAVNPATFGSGYGGTGKAAAPGGRRSRSEADAVKSAGDNVSRAARSGGGSRGSGKSSSGSGSGGSGGSGKSGSSGNSGSSGGSGRKPRGN